MNKRYILIICAVLILFCGFLIGFIFSKQTFGTKTNAPKQETVEGLKISTISSPSPPIINKPESDVRVVRIIDGDTIEIEGGQKVRYIGIDTPETAREVECWGREATSKNRELVEGKIVRLEKDVSETDKYGRLLRYVFIDPSVLVNDYLVREGYALASSYPPDIKYQDQLRQAQEEARQNSKGLWSQCTASPNNSSASSQPDCIIKGNINASGEKIYHMPGQYYYNKTAIDESRGEKWFCTEDEAQSAGFRKSKK